MLVGETPDMATASKWGQTAVVAIAGLLLVVVAPQGYATHWAPKAALALVVIGTGLLFVAAVVGMWVLGRRLSTTAAGHSNWCSSVRRR